MRGSRSLHSLINCLFDLPPHASRMPQDLVTRNPQHLKSSFSQITVAVLIMPKTFGGLMVFTIDFNDQVQRYATKIDGVWWNRVFTTKLLASASTISQHLPDVLRKLICRGSLVTSKLDCVMVTLQSLAHVAPPILRCRLFAAPSSPALLPLQ